MTILATYPVQVLYILQSFLFLVKFSHLNTVSIILLFFANIKQSANLRNVNMFR